MGLAAHSGPAPAPHVATAARIEDSVGICAGRYFHDKYRDGTNASVTFNVDGVTGPPEMMGGWPDQWLVGGEDSTRHRASGTINYQKRTRRFEAIVLAPAGGHPRAKDFTLR